MTTVQEIRDLVKLAINEIDSGPLRRVLEKIPDLLGVAGPAGAPGTNGTNGLPGGTVTSYGPFSVSPASTSSMAFVDLIPAAGFVVPAGSPAAMFVASASVSTPAAAIAPFEIQILIDGSVVQKAGSTTGFGPSVPGSAAINVKVAGLTPGAHTVTLQWRSPAGTALEMNAALRAEHAEIDGIAATT